MAYPTVLILSLAWALSLLGLGSFLARVLRCIDRTAASSLREEVRLAVWGALGVAGFSLSAMAANFFVPLGNYFSYASMALGLGLFCIDARSILGWMKPWQAAAIGVLFLYLSTIPFTPLVTYDTGLYHWQAVKWISQNPLPQGLANLHGRFGFNSGWSVFSALVDIPPKVFGSPNFISNPVILFLYGTSVVLSARRCLAGQLTLSSLFTASTCIPLVIWTPFDMNSPSHDLPVMLLTFLVVHLIIGHFESSEDDLTHLALAAILSAFCLTLKLSAMPLFLGACAVFGVTAFSAYLKGLSFQPGKRNKWWRHQRLGVLLCAVAIITCTVILWMARGIWLSGCVAYPAAVGCLTTPKWAVPLEQVKRMNGTIRIWGRSWGWKDRAAGKVKLGWNFEWLVPWFKSVLPTEKALFAILLTGIVLIAVSIRKKGRVVLQDRSFYIPLIITFFGVCFWLFTSPDPRFGHGFCFGLALLLLCQGLLSTGLANHWIEAIDQIGPVPTVLVLSLGIILCMVGLKWPIVPLLGWTALFLLTGLALSKYVTPAALVYCLLLLGMFLFHSRGLKNYLPATQWASWSRFPKVELTTVKTNQGFSIYKPEKGHQCWDAPMPCAPRPNKRLKIEISETGRYKMFWYDGTK